jgi:hypothetical protein
MNLTIINNGAHPVRVIVDHDTLHDSQIEADEEATVDAPDGFVELRELETSDETTAGEDDDGAP